MSSILSSILIQLLSWAIEKIGQWLFKLIEQNQRNGKIEGDAAKDFVDLKAKKAALDAATGEERVRLQSEFLAAASRFGRLRV